MGGSAMPSESKRNREEKDSAVILSSQSAALGSGSVPSPLLRTNSIRGKKPPLLLSPSTSANWISDGNNAREFVEAHDNFIFGIDGVIWSGDTLLPGALSLLQSLREKSKRLVFITNKSVTRAAVVAKFAQLGFEVDAGDVITSASGAAEYLVTFYPGVEKVYVVGEAGLVNELEQAGIACCGEAEETCGMMDEETFATVQADAAVGAVVCGYDRSFNFRKLSMASLYIQRGAAFIATHREQTHAVCDGRKLPGNAALVAAVESAGGMEAVVTGKPSPLLGEMVVDKYGMDRSRTCVIGDRVDTDIMLGKATGLHTMLAMSGETHEEDLDDVCSNSETCPDYIVEGLAKLTDN